MTNYFCGIESNLKVIPFMLLVESLGKLLFNSWLQVRAANFMHCSYMTAVADGDASFVNIKNRQRVILVMLTLSFACPLVGCIHIQLLF